VAEGEGGSEQKGEGEVGVYQKGEGGVYQMTTRRKGYTVKRYKCTVVHPTHSVGVYSTHMYCSVRFFAISVPVVTYSHIRVILGRWAVEKTKEKKEETLV
jgi:hypothetical protein